MGKTLREAKSLKETFKYLISWFIISDGSSTIISLAIFMGKKKFLLNNTELMIGAILVPFSALIGTYMWLFIQRRMQLTSKSTLLTISFFFAVVPVYVLIGFSGVFGLVYRVEIWPVSYCGKRKRKYWPALVSQKIVKLIVSLSSCFSFSSTLDSCWEPPNRSLVFCTLLCCPRAKNPSSFLSTVLLTSPRLGWDL